MHDPEKLRAMYVEMDTAALCELLLKLATTAHTRALISHPGMSAGPGLASAIDQAAIVTDVLSGRLPDVGT